ncbi:MAG: NADH-quinone oxidoreductase subunit M, partial [Proteobacteria bacterium]|nr:NADH-quinone oxidoreductase subunit M [Pseudomonadota bacterium]
VGELLVLVGIFQVNTWVAALAALGVILGAAYMLWLYRRVIFGALTKDDLKAILDLDRREIAVFAPLIFAVLWMGIYPNSFLDVMHASVDNLIAQAQLAAPAPPLELAADGMR